MKIKLSLTAMALGATLCMGTQALASVSGTQMIQTQTQSVNEKIFQKSGASDQIEATLQMLRATDKRNAAADLYQAKPFQEAILKNMSVLSQGESKKLLSWYESVFGQKVTQEEIQATRAIGSQQMGQDMAKLFQDAKRVRLIEELIAATKSFELQNEMVNKILETSLKALEQQVPKEQFEQMKVMMQEQIKQQEEQTKQAALAVSLYSYRNLSDKEVNKYINFHKEASTQKLTRAVSKGITDVMMEYLTQRLPQK